VNLSCVYEIVFHDSQQSYLKWEHCHSKYLLFIFCFKIVAPAIHMQGSYAVLKSMENLIISQSGKIFLVC